MTHWNTNKQLVHDTIRNTFLGSRADGNKAFKQTPLESFTVPSLCSVLPLLYSLKLNQILQEIIFS